MAAQLWDQHGSAASSLGYPDNGRSRYAAAAVMAALLLCCNWPAAAGVDDVWAASPATQDTQWAQVNMAPVSPSNSGTAPDKMKWVYLSSNSGVNEYEVTTFISIRYMSASGVAICTIFVNDILMSADKNYGSSDEGGLSSCFSAVPAGASWHISPVGSPFNRRNLTVMMLVPAG